MPKNTEQQNLTQNSDKNDKNQNNAQMQNKTIVLGCDSNGVNDSQCQQTVADALQNAGYTVELLDIAPNPFAAYSYSDKAKGKIGVYLIAASLLSFLDAAAANFDYNVLGIRGDVTDWGKEDGFNTKGVPKDHHGDCTLPECDKYQGKTYPELNEIYKGKCVAVPGETPEKLAQNIIAALGGEYNGTNGAVVTSGGAQIKDKTFEKCIRRICAATDSVFLVENNAAVLFPYTDWLAFTLREKISTITPKEIDPDVFSMEYNNEGTYNKVSIAWGGETLPERFPNNSLMHEKYLEKQKNKQTETTVTKKNGTTQKNTTSPDGTNILSEQYDLLVKKYGELEKRIESPVQDYETAQYLVNALLIQYVRDFNNSCECRALGNRRYIGGTFYIVTNPFTYEKEMLYLNGYTVRTQKDEPIYFDLDFKYGPESAEELLDYQFYTGGSGAVSSGTTGESSTEAEIWKHASKFCHYWSCGELREAESDTNDPQTAVDYVKKKEAANTPKICLSCYGMSAWLYYYFNNNAKIPCRVIFGGGHKVVELFKNNKWYKPIEEYHQLDEGFRYNDACKGSNVEVTLQPPGGSP